MINFLKETEEALATAGKKADDIMQIGGGEYRCTWEEFVKLADFDYHEGFGAQKIASDLTIVFRDGSWLERSEYDGSEGWEYKGTPAFIPLHTKPITRLQVRDDQVGWKTLEQING